MTPQPEQSNAERFDAAFREVYPFFRYWVWGKGQLTYRQIDDQFNRGLLDSEFKEWREQKIRRAG